MTLQSWTCVSRHSKALALYLAACWRSPTWEPTKPSPSLRLHPYSPIGGVPEQLTRWLTLLKPGAEPGSYLNDWAPPCSGLHALCTLLLDFLAFWLGVTPSICFVVLTSRLSPDSALLVSWPSGLLNSCLVTMDTQSGRLQPSCDTDEANTTISCLFPTLLFTKCFLGYC